MKVILIGLLSLLVLAVQPVTAKQYTVLVPVFVVSDRKPVYSFHDMLSAEDQVFNKQSIVFRTCGIPIRIDVHADQETDLLAKYTTAEDAKYFLPSLDQLQEELEFQKPTEAEYGGPSVFDDFGFQKALSKYLMSSAGATNSELCVFVHGCCISQVDSLRQAAILSLMLSKPIVAFDWTTKSTKEYASLPEFNVYRKSERAMEISQTYFNQFLESIHRNFPLADCTLIGHSMGNRMITGYLLEHQSSDERRRIQTVHLSRPDQSITAFVAQEDRICKGVGKVFLYYSDNDKWLRRSSVLSSTSPRLGLPEQLENLLKTGSSRNFYPIDVSYLKLNHGIPFSVISRASKNPVAFQNKTLSADEWMRLLEDCRVSEIVPIMK